MRHARLDLISIALTLVECKLWRNPQARREVIAQALDYAQTLSRWTYADLQRQVATATGLSGNVPFELARKRDTTLNEETFVDRVSQALHDCRILLIVAGNGIHGSVGAMAELLNRNAGRAFTFALVDIGLYEMPDQRLLVHASVPMKTQIIERHVVLARGNHLGREQPQTVEIVEELEQAPGGGAKSASDLSRAERYRSWWQPLLDRPLREPEQTPPRFFYPNHVRVILPGGDTWILAYASGVETAGVPQEVGVGLRGRTGAHLRLLGQLAPEIPAILAEVPELVLDDGGPEVWLGAVRSGKDFADANDCREWLFRIMDAMVAALRPRIILLASRDD